MKKLILDLDTGVDDTLAISYALGSPEMELIGITGTYGNVLMEQGVRNALAITDLLGHPEVKFIKVFHTQAQKIRLKCFQYLLLFMVTMELAMLKFQILLAKQKMNPLLISLLIP